MGMNVRYSPLEWIQSLKRFRWHTRDGSDDFDFFVRRMTPAPVIASSAAAYESTVVRSGDIIKTTIVLDLTGLKSTATNKDIIGDTGVSHIGQITAAVNGTIFKGQMGCMEVPVAGDDDIDLYSADEGTGAYDADGSGLTETVLVTAGGAHAIGTVKPFTALPVANEYLYLVTGDTTGGTYSAGIIYIEMWGYVA